MIRFVNVSFTYKNNNIQTPALKNVDLHIGKQEFVFLVGPTGGGKSTILRHIYRQVVPSEGSVYVFARDTQMIRHQDLPYFRRKIGIIFQDFLLLPNKSAYDNIAFALEVCGASSRIIKHSVPEVLEWVGMSAKAAMKPSELSGGEQQRICIARALVNRPPLLVADEPTGNLDPDTSFEIMELIRRINLRGTTVIVATHDENIVNYYQQRVVTVDKGDIVSDITKGGYSN